MLPAYFEIAYGTHSGWSQNGEQIWVRSATGKDLNPITVALTMARALKLVDAILQRAGLVAMRNELRPRCFAIELGAFTVWKKGWPEVIDLTPAGRRLARMERQAKRPGGPKSIAGSPNMPPKRLDWHESSAPRSVQRLNQRQLQKAASRKRHFS